MIYKDIISTNTQKVLKYLLLCPAKLCYEREVARSAKISYGSANYILNQLYKKGIAQKKNKGKMCFYSVDYSNPYIKEFKILNNLVLLEPLIEKLKSYSYKIVLYGSWADGTDTEDSDIDLFVISSDKDKVYSIVNKFSYSNKMYNRKIQAVISSPTDLLNREKKEEVFFREIEKGKILWERKINEDNL